MNRRTWLKSFLIALASPSQAALARTQPVTRLDDVLEPLRAKHGLPALAGAVVSKGQIVTAAAVGARLLNSGKKVTVNDRFHLGSDTKAMTATLAGMAVEAGKLRLGHDDWRRARRQGSGDQSAARRGDAGAACCRIPAAYPPTRTRC